jgi:hypothetical protein
MKHFRQRMKCASGCGFWKQHPLERNAMTPHCPVPLTDFPNVLLAQFRQRMKRASGFDLGLFHPLALFIRWSTTL